MSAAKKIATGWRMPGPRRSAPQAHRRRRQRGDPGVASRSSGRRTRSSPFVPDLGATRSRVRHDADSSRNGARPRVIGPSWRAVRGSSAPRPRAHRHRRRLLRRARRAALPRAAPGPRARTAVAPALARLDPEEADGPSLTVALVLIFGGGIVLAALAVLVRDSHARRASTAPSRTGATAMRRVLDARHPSIVHRPRVKHGWPRSRASSWRSSTSADAQPLGRPVPVAVIVGDKLLTNGLKRSWTASVRI